MVQIDTSSSQHHAFLHGLAHDDELRAQLIADPAATLSRFGIAFDESEMPETVSLPSAEALRTTLMANSDRVMGNQPWMPFLPTD